MRLPHPPARQVLDMVWSEAPVATSLDGLTDADTAQTFQLLVVELQRRFGEMQTDVERERQAQAVQAVAFQFRHAG